MVSQFTVGYPTDKHGRSFQRRRWFPFAIAVAVLVVITLIVWVTALTGGSVEATTTACNAAPAPAKKGAPAPTLSKVSSADFVEQIPAPLSQFTVRVLNASTQRGAARSVLDNLTSQGFTPAPVTPYADDPVYPNQNLNCAGQIRFGDAGKSAAAALWISQPCSELVNDGRKDTVVDLALGTENTQSPLSQDAQAVLDALRASAGRGNAAPVDPSLVKVAHSHAC